MKLRILLAALCIALLAAGCNRRGDTGESSEIIQESPTVSMVEPPADSLPDGITPPIGQNPPSTPEDGITPPIGENPSMPAVTPPIGEAPLDEQSMIEPIQR